MIIRLNNMIKLKHIIAIVSIFTFLVIFSYSQSQEPNAISKPGFVSNIQISKDDKYVYNKTTRVNVTKILDGEKGYPEFIYKIDIPKVDDFEFILALDSSGSFGDGDIVSQANAVRGAVPDFIKKIPERYGDKNFNITIISWDKDIDFIYPTNGSKDPFSSNDAKKAELANVTNAYRDLYTYKVFDKSNDKYYYTREEEITDLSQPINFSLDIFKRIKVNEFNRTSRFIILVTGRSEYLPYNPGMLTKAKELNCSIYVIGMDLLKSETNMSRQLKRLTDYDKNKYQALSIAADAGQLERDLSEALQNALDNAINEPAVTNLTIVESLYGYVYPNLKRISIVERVKNKSSEIHPGYRFYDTPVQNGKIRKIKIELLDGLHPESETTISFGADIRLNRFPLSFSTESINFFSEMAKIGGSPDQHISYTWLKRLPTFNKLPDIPVDLNINS